MADVTELEKKEEEFLFQGTKLACKNELLDKGCFVYGGHWYDEAMNFNHGKGGQIKKEAIIRRILIKDCLDNWEKTTERCKKAQKFKILNKKEPFDLEIVLQIFAYEDTEDWRLYINFDSFYCLLCKIMKIILQLIFHQVFCTGTV